MKILIHYGDEVKQKLGLRAEPVVIEVEGEVKEESVLKIVEQKALYQPVNPSVTRQVDAWVVTENV